MQVDINSVLVVIGSVVTVIITNLYGIARARYQNQVDVAQVNDIREKQQANLEERVMAWVDRLERMLEKSQSDLSKCNDERHRLERELSDCKGALSQK